MGFEIGTDGIGGLAVGFDGSDPSRDALAFGVGVARRNQARLTVVYVVSAADEGLAAINPTASAESFIARNDTIADLRNEVQQLIADSHVDGEFVVREGDPAAALEEVAATRKLDAILVGRSRSRRRRVVGWVPARLLRLAQPPISVVP